MDSIILGGTYLLVISLICICIAALLFSAMNMDIKGIEAAEFFRCKKRPMASNMEHSERQEEPGEASPAANRKKNVEGVGYGSDQELPVQKGLNLRSILSACLCSLFVVFVFITKIIGN